MEHLKHGLIFSFMFAGMMLFLNLIAWRGVEWAAAVSTIMFVPLAWFWKAIGISESLTIGHIVLILLLIPVYYLIIGFFSGFLFSLLCGTILTRIEERRYSRQNPEDLNNDNIEE